MGERDTLRVFSHRLTSLVSVMRKILVSYGWVDKDASAEELLAKAEGFELTERLFMEYNKVYEEYRLFLGHYSETEV